MAGTETEMGAGVQMIKTARWWGSRYRVVVYRNAVEPKI